MLSVCMIVKNESAVLDRSLSSVAEVAGEIVVVDTGSTDGTKDIALRRGAKLLAAEWTGDFSAARNVALDAATNPWILILDADEYLYEEDIPKLNEILSAARNGSKANSPRIPLAYLFTVEGRDRKMKEAGGSSRYPSLRLFRNLPTIRYQGEIHENVTLPSGETAAYAAVRIAHDLSHLSESEMAAKRKRNVQLLRGAIKKDPKNPDLHHYLADEYSEIGKADLAVDSYRRSISHRERAGIMRSPRSAHAAKRIAVSLSELGRTDEALAVVDEAALTYPDYTDLIFTRGLLCFARRDMTGAREAFSRAAAMGDAPPKYVSSAGAGSFAARRALNLVEEQVRQQGEMISALFRER